MLLVTRLFSRSLEYCRSLEGFLYGYGAALQKRPFYTTGVETSEVSLEVPESDHIELNLPDDAGLKGPVELKQIPWGKWSRRTGVIAIKLGMTQMWDKEGFPMAATVLQVIDNQVVMVRTRRKEGYNGMQIGAINEMKLKNVLKPVLGQFRRAGVPPKKKLMEFRTTHDALLPVGTPLHASHYVPGQFVDVCAKSMGKGFQGVMKRHNMKGQPASHGVTKTHRKMGATGGGQEPGRIWPGKRMPGRMGGKRVTTICHQVLRVNSKYNAIYVKGPVPGPKNAYVRITDARFKKTFTDAPFPTFIPELNPDQPEEIYADNVHVPHEGSVVFEDKRKRKAKVKKE